MDLKRSKRSETSQLSALCHDAISFNKKMAILSFHNSQWTRAAGIFLVIVEYSQLIAQALFLNVNYNNYINSSDGFSQALIYIYKTINPGYIFPLNEDDPTTYTIIILTIVYTALKYILFGYITLISAYQMDKMYFPILIRIWKVIFKAQGRVLYFLLTSFWLVVILNAFQNNYTIFGLGTVGTPIFFMTLLIMDYLFSLFLDAYFWSILPTKHYLSSKSRHTEILTLTQKFSIQILQVILISYPSVNFWIYGSVNLLFGIARNYNYFATLPVYRSQALFLQGYLLVILFSLDVACFAQYIDKSLDDNYDSLKLTLLIWLALGVLTVKMSHSYLNKLLTAIVSKGIKFNPHLLIHKIRTIKYLYKRAKLPSVFNDNYDFSYIVSLAMNSNLKLVLNLDSKSGNSEHLQIDSKESMNKGFILYLKSLQEKFPKDNLVKLYVAQLYAKKFKLYGIAMKLLAEVQRTGSRVISLNASLLTWDMQELIRADSANENAGLDVFHYFSAQLRSAELKKKILGQLELQIELYQELGADCPNLARIFNHAQDINKVRKNIEKEATLLPKEIPEYCMEPFLLAADYQLTVNYSPINYKKYFKIYSQRYQRYEKHLQEENLIPQNCYQDNTAFVIVSGRREDLGKVIFATNSITNIYGGDIGLYHESHISGLVPINFQEFCSLFFESKATRDDDLIKQIFRGYSCHKEGYLMELDFYLDVFPFLTQGLCFCFIIRPVPSSREYMLIRDNGNIEGATKNLSQQLGLAKMYNASLNGSYNVKLVSEELHNINNAFNLLAISNDIEATEALEPPPLLDRKSTSKRRRWSSSKPISLRTTTSHPSLELSKALELYHVLTTEGKDIVVKPIQTKAPSKLSISKTEDTSFIYHCQIKIITHNSATMKLVTLQQSRKANILSQTHETDSQHKGHSDILHELGQNDAAFINKMNDSANISNPENSHEIADETQVEAQKVKYHFRVNSLFNTAEEEAKAFHRESTNLDKPRFNSISYHHFNSNPTATATAIMTTSPDVKGGSKIPSKQVRPSTETSQKQIEKNQDNHLYEAETARASQWSKSSDKARVEKAIDYALRIKYYPKSIILFCIVFYALLISIVAIQIQRILSLSKTITNLKAKKELIRSSLQRDSLLINTQLTSLLMWDSYTGALDLTQLGVFSYLTTSDFLNAMSDNLASLSEVNQVLMITVGEIDEAASVGLFDRNVKMVYTDPGSTEQHLLYLTDFQATDEIVQTGLRAIKPLDDNLTNSENSLSFIFRNTANDLLLQNEAISSNFYDSITETIEDRRGITNEFMYVRIALLIVAFIILTWLITKKCTSEKRNVMALVKLDSQEMQGVIERLISFKRNLELGNLSTWKNDLSVSKISKQKAKSQKFAAKKHFHTSDDKGINRKYFMYVVEGFIVFLLVIAFIIWISISAVNSNEFLRAEEAKLYFSDNMVKTINMAFLAYQDLYATNNAGSLRDISASSQLTQTINDLSTIRNNAMQELSSEDGTDPVIEDILYTNGCQFLGTSITYCNLLEGKALQTGLINLLSNYEQLVQDRLDAYKSSSGTPDALKIERTTDFDMLYALKNVLVDESSLIATRLADNFETRFAELSRERALITDIFYLALALAAVLGWILVFEKLMNASNKFKTVLRAFPPTLVVSNFILKSFLVKTSGETLSFKKIES